MKPALRLALCCAAASFAMGTLAPIPEAAALSNDGLYHQLQGSRLGDTRYSSGFGRGRLAAGQTGTLPVLGRGGVPTSGVSAVVLNVTAIKAGGTGWLTAYASGTARPNTSILNYPQGWTGAGTVTVPVGGDGKVAFYAGGSSVDLAVDVVGWYSTAASSATHGSVFWPTEPDRWGDTRIDGFKLQSGDAYEVPFTYVPEGTTDVPTAALVNLTALNGTGNGWLSAESADGTVQRTSAVNFARGEISPNLTVLPVRSWGDNEYTITVVNTSPYAVDVLVDVQGWYHDDSAQIGFKHTVVRPTRIVDTRYGTGTSRAPLGHGETRRFSTIPAAVLGSQVPAALEGTMTGVGATQGTYLTQWSGFEPLPTTSSLNLVKTTARANGMSTVLDYDPDTRAAQFVTRNAWGSVHLIEDVTGRWDPADGLVAETPSQRQRAVKRTANRIDAKAARVDRR